MQCAGSSTGCAAAGQGGKPAGRVGRAAVRSAARHVRLARLTRAPADRVAVLQPGAAVR